MLLDELIARHPYLLLDSIQHGVYVTDRDRRIVYWSQAAERITGWRRQDIVGQCCYQNVLCHVDKDGRQLCGQEFCPLHRSIVTGQSSEVPVIVFARDPDGRRIPMRVSVAPLKDEEGAIIGGVESFQDLSAEFADTQRGRRIQEASMSSADVAEDPRLALEVHYAPHDIIGGDYYSLRRLDADQVGFLLADVCGHGLSAALYTMHLGSLWDDFSDQGKEPGKFLGLVNGRLCQLLHSNSDFATAICGVLNLKQRTIRLASAGGPTPLIYRASRAGAAEEPDCSGQPLGFAPEGDFGEVCVNLAPGDRVLLFTDGVYEISQANGEQLGVQGLQAILQEMDYPQKPLEFPELERRLLAFSNGIRFDDDLTVIELTLRA